VAALRVRNTTKRLCMTPTTPALRTTPPIPPRCIASGVRQLECAQAHSSKPRLTLGQEGRQEGSSFCYRLLEKSVLPEVVILRYDRITVVARVGPDCGVRRASHIEALDLVLPGNPSARSSMSRGLMTNSSKVKSQHPIAHTGCCRHTRNAEPPRSYRRVQSTCAIRQDGLR